MSIQLKSIQLKNSYINLLKYSYVVVFLYSCILMFLCSFQFNSIQSSLILNGLSLCITYQLIKTNMQFNYIFLNCNKPIERNWTNETK